MHIDMIWRFEEDVFLVFDHVAHDWCGQFKTLHEAEACADELEHEFPSTAECVISQKEGTQTPTGALNSIIGPLN